MKELPINQIINGDALKVMKSWPSNSVDMCMTSPPYWGLRDYGVEQIFGGDKDCEHEWGNYINGKKLRGTDTNREKSKEVYPIIHLSGSNFCLKCHAWKGQLGLEPQPEMYIEHLTEIFNEVKRVLKKTGTLWLNIGDTYSSTAAGNPGCSGLPRNSVSATHAERMDTSKCGIIQKCLCMIPERLAWSLIQNGWILRNKIIWYKPNGMPSSVKDRFSNKWEYVYYFVKSQRNYFDLDAVREPTIWDGIQWGNVAKKFKDAGLVSNHEFKDHPLGKNPGDVWNIPTVPCPIRGIHFATFPEDLCRKAIIPGCPEEGIVLDPFCGIGTACYVAQRLRRRFIGIDIKPEFCEKAENERLVQGVLI